MWNMGSCRRVLDRRFKSGVSRSDDDLVQSVQADSASVQGNENGTPAIDVPFVFVCVSNDLLRFEHRDGEIRR